MSDVAIRCEGLSKQYRIGERLRYRTFRDTLARTASAPFRRLRPPIQRSNVETPKRSNDSFWALNDVSFEVKRGEVLGVIGRNGAGKSTLLKVLSRITEPTAGRALIDGRVGSLLEVGTGFNPELTGRENIYLNGAILGMRRAEILKTFDSIVEFAEVEKFVDTPVKYYSSGMYVRLAFAVAAHLNPDIMLVDEVLSVGDAEFQKKCMGKMGEVAKHGRTVLFVSHNMPAVTRLCQRGIVLDRGALKFDADIFDAAARYMQSELGTSAHREWPDPDSAPGDAVARLKSVRVVSEGKPKDTIDIRMPVTIEMEYWNLVAGADLVSFLSFFNDQGVILFVSADFEERQWGSRPRPRGVYRTRCTVPGNFLAEGQLSVTAEVSTRFPMYEIHFLEHDSVCIQVVDQNEPGSVRAGWGRPLPGVVRPRLQWETDFVSSCE